MKMQFICVSGWFYFIDIENQTGYGFIIIDIDIENQTGSTYVILLYINPINTHMIQHFDVHLFEYPHCYLFLD